MYTTYPFCDCGSVDKYGDDLGEHGATCPYHLAVIQAYEAGVPDSEINQICKNTLREMSRA